MRLVAIALTAIIAMAAAATIAFAPGASALPHRSAGPGLGLSKEAPEGPVFSLPPGLELQNPILAHSPENPVDCDNKYPEDGFGSGDAVTLCLIFRNTTDRSITLTLPPGLLVVAHSDKVQGGFLVQRTVIEVPAGDRYFAPLFLHCANEDRDPSTPGDEYALGPVISYPQFEQFYRLLEGKQISRQETAYVQFVIIRLTQGERLTQEDRATLAAM